MLPRIRNAFKGGSSRALIVGQLIGQLALLIAIPFLTRLLSPSEMGLYQVGFSLALILQPVATLRQELVIPFGSVDEVRRHRLIGLSSTLGLCFLVIIAGLVAMMLNTPNVAVTAMCTALILGSLGIIYVENAYLIRCGAKRRLALRNLIGGVVAAFLQICAALIFGSAIAIAFALLIGRVVAAGVTVVKVSVPPGSSEVRRARPQRPVSSILSAMIASASSQAVIVGSVISMGAASGAQVAIAQRIAATPSSLVGQALMQVSLSSAAPLIREGRSGLTSQLRAQTLRIASFASLLTLLLAVFGPLLAEPILGPAWSQAGVLIAIFAVPLGLTLVALPATTLLIPLGRERTLMMLQAIRLLSILGALGISAYFLENIVLVSACTAIVWTLAYIPLMAVAFRAALSHDQRSEGDPS